MKVSELIEKLKGFNPNSEVLLTTTLIEDRYKGESLEVWLSNVKSTFPITELVGEDE